jgi:hypothetical protein
MLMSGNTTGTGLVVSPSRSAKIGKGITSAAPGSLQNLHPVVSDIEEARADLMGRGIDVSEVFHDAGGIFHHSRLTRHSAAKAGESQ